MCRLHYREAFPECGLGSLVRYTTQPCCLAADVHRFLVDGKAESISPKHTHQVGSKSYSASAQGGCALVTYSLLALPAGMAACKLRKIII